MIVLGGVILIGICGGISKILTAISQFTNLVSQIRQRRSRHSALARFADGIKVALLTVNLGEEWNDNQFAELEAEVELEEASWVNRLRINSKVNRVRSLSLALKKSSGQHIILQGDPGAGKSVAMRHVALTLTNDASTKRKPKVIPLYVNLKELNRLEAEDIDSEFFRSAILRQLNKSNARDIREFLKAEFDEGLRSGKWLFLLDSFDEIPEILASSSTDEVVNLYMQAITGFFNPLNSCRVIIASREYHSPPAVGWSVFRIVSLSKARQKALVRRQIDSAEDRAALLLGVESSEFR